MIFSNILDIHSFSLSFLSALEDTVEITEQDKIPLIGGCIEETVEVSVVEYLPSVAPFQPLLVVLDTLSVYIAGYALIE